MTLLDEFAHSLHMLQGQRCCFVGGPSAGTFINLDFGDEVLRNVPVKNPSLPERQRWYQGTFILFIQCVWRIDSEGEILCGCWDDIGQDAPPRRHFTSLAGQKVTGVEIATPGLDLAIRFGNSYVLRIFCDQVNELDDYSNYSLFTPAKVYTVGCRSKLRFEKRGDS